tara:strand:+ start:527 stop:727 length:201 start_codon:yes stop_codon:yes gene_type:complete
MPHCEEMLCHLALLEREQKESKTRKQFEEHFVLVKSAEGDYWKPKVDFDYDALKFKQLSIPSADKV